MVLDPGDAQRAKNFLRRSGADQSVDCIETLVRPLAPTQKSLRGAGRKRSPGWVRGVGDPRSDLPAATACGSHYFKFTAECLAVAHMGPAFAVAKR